jgi:hypothetical protein
MTMPSDNKERELEDWWVETNGTGTDACSSCNPEFICSWHTARLDDLVALIADQCRLARREERSLAMMYLYETNRLEDYKRKLKSLKENI